jgi:uncharacterized protein
MRKVIILVFLFISFHVSGTDIPMLSGRVNDYSNLLSPETIQLLTDSLKLHDDQTGNEIVILTVTSLEGENLEDYANQVFRAWKLGKKDQDNGILFLIVPDERKVRIEVGYGLEDKMTDLMSKRIIQEVITPNFKNGDYDKGVIEGVSRMIYVLNGGIIQENDDSDSVLPAVDTPDMSITEKILFGSFIFGIIGLFTVIGVVTPGVGWFLYFFLIPFWAMFPIVIVGTRGALICLVLYLVLFPIAKLFLKKTDWYKKAKKDLRSKGHASIGGFSVSGWGGSHSSGSSWSSGSSSGFSGGGGSSGGGGASGSW